MKTLIPPVENFQQVVEGKPTDLYLMQNDDMQLALTNFGARIVSLIVKDKEGGTGCGIRIR